MATLNRYKILATQCGVAQSPTTSPVVHLRRPKTTLQMLLSGRLPSPSPPKRRGTLKDLFVSSSPNIEEEKEQEETFGRGECEVFKTKPDGGWIGFRHRVMIRRAWRPILAGIPENES